jgi:hypothetical protein
MAHIDIIQGQDERCGREREQTSEKEKILAAYHGVLRETKSQRSWVSQTSETSGLKCGLTRRRGVNSSALESVACVSFSFLNVVCCHFTMKKVG